MYVAPQLGQAAAQTAAAPTLHVGTYRRALLAVIVGNPLFSEAEQLRANHAAHECTCPVRLARWTRNSLRVAKEREAAAQPTGNLLADLQNPAYVAQHGSKQAAAGFKTLSVADAYKAAEGLRQAFAAGAQQQPAAPVEQPVEPAAPAVTYATPAQCDELHRLSLSPCLTRAERQLAHRALPTATEPEARALLLRLRDLASTPRLRLTEPVTVGQRLVVVTLPEQQYEAAKVDYVRDIETGQARPRLHTRYGGALVQRVWAN